MPVGFSLFDQESRLDSTVHLSDCTPPARSRNLTKCRVNHPQQTVPPVGRNFPCPATVPVCPCEPAETRPSQRITFRQIRGIPSSSEQRGTSVASQQVLQASRPRRCHGRVDGVTRRAPTGIGG